MTYETLLVRHSDISEELLEEIYQLKAIRWNYNANQQKVWIQKNIFPADHHVIIIKNNRIIAYTNLVNVNVNINGTKENVKGVGNVCTSESGLGFGNVLMKMVNQIILEDKSKGLLMCRDYLIPYYEKFSWKLINKDRIRSNVFSDINMMSFNIDIDVLSLDYNDRNF